MSAMSGYPSKEVRQKAADRFIEIGRAARDTRRSMTWSSTPRSRTCPTRCPTSASLPDERVPVYCNPEDEVIVLSCKREPGWIEVGYVFGLCADKGFADVVMAE